MPKTETAAAPRYYVEYISAPYSGAPGFAVIDRHDRGPDGNDDERIIALYRERADAEYDAAERNTPGADRPKRYRINSRELATVLAALRLWQRAKQRGPVWGALATIADDGGECVPLTLAEIDALCERLNTVQSGRSAT